MTKKQALSTKGSPVYFLAMGDTSPGWKYYVQECKVIGSATWSCNGVFVEDLNGYRHNISPKYLFTSPDGAIQDRRIEAGSEKVTLELKTFQVNEILAKLDDVSKQVQEDLM